MTSNHGEDDSSCEPASQELLNLIWDLSQGVISEADQVRLDSLLLESAENRATYAQFMQLIALLEHDPAEPNGGGDAPLNIVAGSSVATPDLSRRMESTSQSFPDRRMTSGKSLAAVVCATICLLVTFASMFLFAPKQDRTIARRDPVSDSDQTVGHNQMPQANEDELFPENSPVFQQLLDELAQLNSGGP